MEKNKGKIYEFLFESSPDLNELIKYTSILFEVEKSDIGNLDNQKCSKISLDVQKLNGDIGFNLVVSVFVDSDIVPLDDLLVVKFFAQKTGEILLTSNDKSNNPFLWFKVLPDGSVLEVEEEPIDEIESIVITDFEQEV